MATKDLSEQVVYSQSLVPARRTASANGSAVDRKNNASNDFLVDVGAWVDGTHTFSAEEADAAAGPWTAVAAGDLNGSFTVVSGAGQANQNYRIGYLGSRRFVRAVVTVAGAATGADYGVSVVGGHPRYAGNTNF